MASTHQPNNPPIGVAIIGTHARGGIRAVIENHIAAGVYQDYKTYVIASHIEGSTITRTWQFIKALGQLIGLLLSKKISICHMHGSMKGSLWRKAILTLFCERLHCKVVFHLHGSQFAKVYENSGSVYRWLVGYLFNHSQQIFVLSNYWLEYVKPIIKHDNICIINNFPSPQFESISVTKKTNTDTHKHLLFLGYIGDRKGIYDLVDAVEFLLTDNEGDSGGDSGGDNGSNSSANNFTLHVGGNGEIDKLKQRIASKKLSQYIRVIGWVDEQQKYALLQQADLFILPSYNEGLPIAILEAMAASVPVISTPVGGIPDAIVHQETGLLVTPGDSQAIAASIEACLSDPALAQNLASNALLLYQTYYSANANMTRIQEALQTLLTQKQS